MTAPETESAEAVAPEPSKRGPVATYLRANPFVALLSVIVIVTGLVFGTFWGPAPDSVSAGVITTVDSQYWWTPLTALLVPSSLLSALFALALLLTVGAYAERRLGSRRAGAAFIVTGLAGILIGIGAQVVASAWGEDWGSFQSLDLVADPTIGVVGMVMAASASAPALWQRRIRVIGFTLLLMFALYAADSDSVFRFIAGLVGLVGGIVLSGRTARGSWHRSSYREVRTLVAAIVAATGLGPIIVLVSGSLAAPLGLVVAGFAPSSDADLSATCIDDMTADCLRQADALITGGPGPFLVSMVPLILTLLAAWGLRTGRRAAWMLGLGANIAVAILTGVSLGITEILDPQALDIVGIEFTILSMLALAVPLAVVALLVITRRRFSVRAPRTAAIRYGLTVVGGFIVLAAAYVVTGLVDGDDYLEGPPTLAALLRDVLRPFLPSGFLPAVTVDAIPVDGAALFVYQWIGVAFWALFIVATIQLYRATHLERDSVDEERFRDLLKAGGGGTLGFMGTWPGNSYWFTEDGTGAVAYRVINRIALTTSDPVCAPGEERAIVAGFVEYCEKQGWSACFYSFHERFLPIFESFGWQTMAVGEETVLDLEGLEFAGKAWQKVRQPLNKGQREGITTLWSTWDDLPAHFAAEIQTVSEEWVANKKLPEMGFTLGGMDELKDRDVALFLAIDKDGKIAATTSWLPSWTDGRITGWTIDFMRRSDGAMGGIMEFVIASAALYMKESGAKVMSLSGAPLATKPGAERGDPTVMDRLLEWLGQMLEPAYGFTSLFRFKSKFNPRYETISMAYADPAKLPQIGSAIGSAYLPHATPKEYVALVQTITKRGDGH